MSKSTLWPALAGLLLIAFIVGLLLFETKSTDTASDINNLGGDFTLQSQNGSVSLADFRGKYVVIYFGYTSCPDICPTSLGALSQALNQMSVAEIKQIQTLFISVDPERDTLEKLQQYAAYFHPDMLGITGDLNDLEQIAEQYGAYFRKAQMEESTMGYAVDHSSSIYLVGSNGKLKDIIQHSDSPQVILEQIRALLSQ